jgi:hypothetical protein
MTCAPLTPRDDTAELTDLARQILRDRYNPFAWYNTAFTVHDWVNAAEQALEGDFDDLRYYSAGMSGFMLVIPLRVTAITPTT